jgi:hypothetical protein
VFLTAAARPVDADTALRARRSPRPGDADAGNAEIAQQQAAARR